MICAPSVGEGQDAKFELVFTAVRYICSYVKLKKELMWCISQNTIISNSFSEWKIEVNYIDLLTISYSK